MYTFRNTERNLEKSSEFETKSLLYLIAMRKDSREIQFLFIDCFNDVTGANKSLSKLWDVQSKGVSSLNPLKIGQSLITLYKNYCHDLNFCDFVLFIPKLNPNYLQNNNLIVYKLDNFQKKYLAKIRQGLVSNSTTFDVKIPDMSSGKNVDNFLAKVIFVCAREETENYIKDIIKFKNKDSHTKDFYLSVFDEIRALQSSKKNKSVENKTVGSLKDALLLGKHIKSQDIEVLVVNRLVGLDIFNMPGIPEPFVDIVKDLDSESRKDLIQTCNEEISKAFFNKNNKTSFWKLLETSLNLVRDYPKKGIRELLSLIPKEPLKDCLNDDAKLYLLALIKRGLNNDN